MTFFVTNGGVVGGSGPPPPPPPPPVISTGTAFVDQEAVLGVFYKTTHKDQYNKGFWLTLYTTLFECLCDPTS